ESYIHTLPIRRSSDIAVYWDELGSTLALPYPKVNLLESFGATSGLMLTFAGLAVAMLLVHLNDKRFQTKRSPTREPGQTESLARSEEHTSELQSHENL